jgi:serine/threonine protein kinase
VRTVADSLAPEFVIERRLGEGRTSLVFLAREPALRRLVAIKMLRPEVGEDETARARFEREAHSMAGISHPHVPRVLRVGRLGTGLPYIVQEFVEGRSLRDELEATGAMAPERARRILSEVASTLEASHAKGVIHRDVRPESVLVEDGSGKAFLTDFGLAAVRASGDSVNPRLTRTGELLGDPHYMSPEQLRGDPLTAAADVYSLGVMGYEMLTLTNPFGARTTQALFGAHLSDQPAALPWSVTGPDTALGEILVRCLRKEPARRPRAEELAREFSGVVGPHSQEPSGILASFPKLAAFVGELRRRGVYKVGVGYALAMAALVQVSAASLLVSYPAAHRTLMVVMLAGFPIVLALAWVFELSSSGIRRTESGANGPGRASKVIGLLFGVAMAGLVGWLLLF